MMKPPHDLTKQEDLREMVQILQETSKDLSPCGRSVLSLVSRIFSILLDPTTTASSLSDATTLASSLLRLSNEKLNSYPYRQVPLSWRRLYTDSSLLKSISQLSNPSLSTTESDSLRVIRDLDMVLIIAGAPGPDRPLLVSTLISIAQSRSPISPPLSWSEERPTKRSRPNPTRNSPRINPPYISRPLPILKELPDFLLPSSNLSHSRPFIVRQAASDWSAVKNWKEVNYLREVGGGPGRVVPVEVGKDYTKQGWGQRILPWWEFLESTFNHEEGEEGEEDETFYLAQHSLLNQFPELEKDFMIPSLVYSDLQEGGSTGGVEGVEGGYQGIGNEEGWIVNAWLGRGGTVSQAHTDPYWNCYIQAVGSKWVWIAPPSVGPHMSTFGHTNVEGREGSEEAEENGQGTGTTDYMTNTSTIDVTLPLPSTTSPLTVPDSSNGGNYPKKWLEEVEPVAQQIVLEAGDVLVMPPGWWHAMKSLETSFSISIWF